MSVEQIKISSNGLKGSMPIELKNVEPSFTEEARQLLKFHGIYQQHNRDIRGRKNRQYYFMLRSKIPGGKLTAQQYLVHDLLADEFGQGDLRLTNRQDIQLHGVIKGDLQGTLRALNAVLVTTLGACGDVVRNVMCCPAPFGDTVREQLQSYARQVSDHLLPRTEAYHEIWLIDEEGNKTKQRLEQDDQAAEIIDPIYGRAYLPRKFKIAMTYPGDNCTDIFTNDIGIVGLVAEERADEESAQIDGFNIYVGGGMGQTHGKEETFARLADPLGFVPPNKLVDVVEKIVLVQRDFGERENRRRARMKYLIHEWGIEQFRARVEEYLGYTLQPTKPMPHFGVDDHLGWAQQVDGRWCYGIYVENGRVKDDGARRTRSGLRSILEQFQPTIHITGQQNIILSGFAEEQIPQVEGLLHQYGIVPLEELSQVRRHAMACPALPTCGLAITEAERRLPGLVDGIEQDVIALNLENEAISIRMTGCPNGCARPYVSDIGIVGRSLDKYTVYLGGNLEGTRLNTLYEDMVPADELRSLIYGVLAAYREDRKPGEHLGDWTTRLGPERVRELATGMLVFA